MKYVTVLNYTPEKFPEAGFKIGFEISGELQEEIMQLCIKNKAPVVQLHSLDCTRY
jgi:hypothetical protein